MRFSIKILSTKAKCACNYIYSFTHEAYIYIYIYIYKYIHNLFMMEAYVMVCMLANNK